MSNVLIEENDLTRIANSIRNKKETNQTYKVSEMDDAINDLLVVNDNEWVRPRDWPDYSQVDISNQEIIYLTYKTTTENMWISVRVYGDYTIARGSLSNGIFTAVNSTNCASGTIFQETLPTNEGNYIVYRITPQSGAQLTRFAFARKDDLDSSFYHYGQQQPCVERYCRLPNWVGTKNRSGAQYVWTTRFLVADTVMNATPTGSFANAYDDGGQCLEKVDLSTCSFSEITSAKQAFNAKFILHDLKLPHDLSSSCTDLSNCFYQNYTLKKIDLTGWDTSGVTTFAAMFYQAVELSEIKGIESFDVSSATTLNGMFQECYNLQKLNLSNWKTGAVLTNIGNLFNNCRSLSSELDVSGFNVSNVTTLAGTFYNLKMIESLDLSSWNITNKCTNLSGTFSYCNSLKTFIRPINWDTSNVTTTENMFREDFSLESLDFTGCDFSKLTNMKYMFGSCHNLKYLKAIFNLPSLTTRANISYCFDRCWKLRDFSNITFTNCSFMPGYSYCYWLDKIVAPSTITAAGDYFARDVQHCKYIDFRNVSTVPTLGSANDITTGYNNQIKIFVPTNLFASWVTTSNWSNATLLARTFPASDFDLYNNTAQNTATIDLSGVTWRKNSGYSTNAAVGAAYTTVVPTNSAGKRIASDLVEIPNNTESICITVNPEYQISAFFFDSNDGYLKNQLEWYTSPLLIHPSSILTTSKIVLVIRLGDGTIALDPNDWENSGLTIKYVPVS